MRKLLLLLVFCLGGYVAVNAQSFTGINGTTANLPCNAPCSTFIFKIPHLRTTSNYRFDTIPYTPYPWVTAGGTEDPTLYNDDTYSSQINLPFSFCFYDSSYNKVVVGSNGLITFDETNASCSNAYTISPTIPNGGGTQCAQFSTYYPKASIMGAYSDLDPRPGPSSATNASPADRKIEWRVEGTAPFRRFITSYYHVGTYGNNSCGLATPNTFQIVVFESTGIIHLYFKNKSCLSSTNSGKAIMGVQDYSRTRAVAGDTKNATVWSESNSAYRFMPNGPISRFVKSELFLNNTLVYTADTATTTPGMLDLIFPNICPPATNNIYIVKTTFVDCANLNQLLVLNDTVTITKSNNLNATATTTDATCATANGSITVNVPNGNGAPPYQYSINGGPLQNSNVFTNLAAGPYTVYATDAGGCSSTLNVTVNSQSIPLNGTATPTNTSCPGVNNGSIFVNNPTNGTGPYQYSINGGAYQNVNLFTGLAAGTYVIRIKDALGCVGNPINVTVGTGPGLTNILTSSTNASCPVAANGTISVFGPSNGTPPYQYSINGGPYQNSSVFTGLTPGSYTITVQDNIGCQNSTVITQAVSSNLSITASALSSPTSCNGASNGSITVTPLSGTPPYQYAVDGGPFQPSNVLTGLAAGPHSVVMTDFYGCSTGAFFVSVANGPGITATTSSTNASCPGATDGSITVTPTTGTAPYQYSINGGPYQLSNVFTGLASATYNVVVKDNNGCVSASIPQVVGAGTSITATTTATLTSCPTANDGTITVTPTSGTGPYQYSIDGGAYQNSNVFTGLAAGTHTVVVKDFNGCTSLGITQTVTAGAAITASATSTPTSCPGVNNGTITVTANGTAPYQYSINGGPYQLSNVFTNLAPGSYSIVVLDGNGCITAPVSQSVTAGLALTASAVPTATTCNGASTGTITVTPTSGIAPYQYSIDGGPFQNSNVFSNLPAGTYSIVMQDGGLCTTAPISVTVVAGPGLSTTVQTQTNVSCNGLSDGSVTLNVPALGAPPHQYSLDGSPFQLSPTFNGLAAGPHIINFIDNSGCSGFLNITITEPTLLVSSASVQDVKCKGDNSGVITVTASGGTPPYQYSIDGVIYQTGNTFNVVANAYTVYVKDANGCIKTIPVTINEPAQALSATAVSSAASCVGTADGSVTVTAIGGTSPYQYSLNGTTFQSSNVLAANVGTYSNVTVKDNNGCIAVVAAPQVVLLNDNMVNNILGNDTTVCEGSSVTLQPLTNGLAPTPTFSWTGPNGYTSTSATPSVSPADTAKYYVTETWGLCSRMDSIVVNVKMKPVANAGLDTTICYGTQAFLHATHTRASGAVAYLWTPADLVQRADTANTFTDSLFSTPLQVFKVEVSDLYGCNFKVYDEINVNIRPQVGLFAGHDTVAGLGVPMLFNGVDVNGSGVNNWEWAVLAGTGVQFSSPYVQSPTVVFNNYATTGYVWENSDTIALYGRTPEGCWGSDTIVVRVIKGPEYYMPSVFTPNGNGLNDRYRPVNVNIKQLDFFRIYNRWGELVFSSNRLEDGWDGTYKGKPQPVGTYIWQIRAVTIGGTVITKQGTVVLLR
jgi:gliding motility-associated-like protein